MSERLVELEDLKNRLDTMPNLDYDSLIAEVNTMLQSQPDPNLYLINAVFYRKTLNFTKSIEYATKAKNLFVKLNQCVAAYECLYEIAMCDFDQGKYKSSLEQYLELEDKMISFDVQDFLLTRVQIQITFCSLMLGRYRIVHEYKRKTTYNLRLVPDYQQIRFKAALSYITAKLFYDTAKFEQSLRHYIQAFTYYLNAGDKRNAERMQTNIAELHLKLGNSTLAEEVALGMFDTYTDSPSRRAHTSNILGAIYLDKGDNEKVRSYCSFVSKMENIDATERALAFKLIALSYKNDGNYPSYEKNMEKYEASKGKKSELEKYIAEKY